MNPTPNSWLSANIKSIVTIMVVIFSFTYFFLLEFGFGKVNNDQVLIAVVGWGGLTLGYWFGSSSSSSKKDDAMVSNLGNPTVTGDKPTVNVTQNNPLDTTT